jgi:hypothetical protein
MGMRTTYMGIMNTNTGIRNTYIWVWEHIYMGKRTTYI